MSHDQAVTLIRRCLNSLFAAIERAVAKNNDAVACGLLDAMKRYKFVATLYLLSDVLPILQLYLDTISKHLSVSAKPDTPKGEWMTLKRDFSTTVVVTQMLASDDT